MFRKFLSMSIRMQIVFLILLLAVPSIFLVIYTGFEQREDAIDDARQDCLKFVNSIAREQQAVSGGAEQLMTAISLMPSVQNGNFSALEPILRRIQKADPQYANIAITDKTGIVKASSIHTNRGISVADRKYFQEAVRTGKFSSGEYIIGRFVNKPTINFGYPVNNDRQELIAVIFVALDLDYSKEVFKSLNFPAGASFSLLDHRGVILYRSLDDILSDKLIGNRDPVEEIFSKMVGSADEGTFESIGNDGGLRLFAFRKIRLPHESAPYLYIHASIPQESAIFKANSLMLKRLLLLFSLFALQISLAWFVGKRLIVTPIQHLKTASQQLASEEDITSVSSVVKEGELGELAYSFDSMAEALKQSKRRLTDIIEFLPDATLVIDREGKVIAWNRAIEVMTGVNATDMLGKGDYEYAIPFYGERRPILIDLALHPDPAREKQYTTVQRTGDTVFGESFVSGLSTGYAHLSATASVLRHVNGHIIAAIECIRDNTERRLAEEALQESEEQFRAAFETASIGMAQGDVRTGQFLRVNDKFCEITGYAQEEILSMHVPDIQHPDDRDQDWNLFQQVVRGERKDYQLEKRYIRKDGQVAWVNVNMTVIRDTGGRPVRTMAAIEDITKRKQAEEALRESEERFRLAVVGAPDAIYLRTGLGCFTYLNQAAVRLFGAKSADQLIGTQVRERIHPDERAEFDNRVKLLNEGRVVPMIERIYFRVDGSPFFAEVTAVPFQVNGDNGSLIFVRDITERKLAEAALRDSEAGIRQLQKMEALGTLAGGIAHDFNNILGIVLGYTEMAMMDTGELQEVHANLEQVYKAGLRAQELVKQILTFSRQSEQEKKIVEISPLIKETIKMLRATIPTSIKIKHKILRTSAILADPTQIHQIIMNLVTNASHALQERTDGEIEISLEHKILDGSAGSIHTDLKSGGYVILKVRDNGSGIPIGIIDKIFDPFFTTKETGKGTGMGLSVVHGIVKSHGGVIRVESEVGTGSTFTVFFPALEMDTSPSESKPEDTVTGSDHILFVDDEEALVVLGAHMLERSGYTVDVRTSSRDALDAFRANPQKYDLVITDYTMPGMSGLALSESLLRIRPDIPIIICTGYSDLLTPEKVRTTGVRELIMKPVVRNQLAQAVSKVLTR